MNEIVSYAVLPDEAGAIAVITIDNPPVNAAGHAVREGLVKAAKAFADDPSAKVAVVVGAGRTFIAGANLENRYSRRRFRKSPICWKH